MNSLEKKFHEAIKKRLGNIRNNTPLKKADGYKPSARWKSLSKSDKTNFAKLYTETANKQQIGNGEVALFWLWNYHIDNLDDNDMPKKLVCRAGAAKNEPDLQYNTTKIEVKAYPLGKSKDIKTNIGRFQGKEKFVQLVNQIFSIRNALLGGISKDGKPTKSVTTLLFGYKELAEAAEQFCLLRSALRKMEDDADSDGLPGILKQLKDTTDAWDTLAKNEGLATCVNGRPGGSHIATELIRYGIKEIMGDKPGDKGYMVNVVGENANFANVFKWHQIKIDKMTTKESVLALGSGVKVKDNVDIGDDYSDSTTFGFNGATFAANLFRLFPEGL